ncbi:Ubiquitin carboxyl-terminal hydrolase [Carpediemonas membranifera]|uniref:Ubiquitin carboxyl-terminal hydrolase n=1 Tax=Carpediemonas membranifera TaxID=201153 RepID=A0A8J6AWN5_9EUKA|nr:Ubiquitin carboxyl-terminal hydrolase [Carpediemonas membranifera]|eukprot:KAG9396721.1 Ubiquitin carboxyl-terminal hydrolase [Carpediemonas membranifera]
MTEEIERTCCIDKGLQNLGNTCFLNSTLQNLLRLTTFRNELIKHTDFIESSQNSGVNPDYPITRAFVDLLIHMQSPSPRVLSPANLRRSFIRKHRTFANFKQQDAHEFLTLLLDALSEEHGKHLKTVSNDEESSKTRKTTVIDDTFGGAMQTTVLCTQCGTAYVNTATFTALELPIPNEADELDSDQVDDEQTQHCVQGLKLGVHRDYESLHRLATLEGCLARYTYPETLRGTGYRCDYCTLSDLLDRAKANMPAEKAAQLVPIIERAMDTIRAASEGHRAFTEHEMTEISRLVKNTRFPNTPTVVKASALTAEAMKPVLVLQLNRFMSKGRRLRKNDRSVQFPTTLDLSAYCQPGARAHVAYQLRGAIIHSGSMGGGHYTAVVQGKGGGWHNYSDSSVQTDVGDRLESFRPYVLFYERV